MALVNSDRQKFKDAIAKKNNAIKSNLPFTPCLASKTTSLSREAFAKPSRATL